MTATRATTVSIVGLAESSHAYSSWRARARALVSGRCTEPLERSGGLEGRLHGLGTFTDARQRLSLGLRRQHPKPYRDAVRTRDVPEAARRLARDLEQLCGDVLVKSADNDRHAPLAVGAARCGGRRSLVRHDQWVRK